MTLPRAAAGAAARARNLKIGQQRGEGASRQAKPGRKRLTLWQLTGKSMKCEMMARTCSLPHSRYPSPSHVYVRCYLSHSFAQIYWNCLSNSVYFLRLGRLPFPVCTLRRFIVIFARSPCLSLLLSLSLRQLIRKAVSSDASCHIKHNTRVRRFYASSEFRKFPTYDFRSCFFFRHFPATHTLFVIHFACNFLYCRTALHTRH